jgi:Helix-turn-helix domain
MMMADNADCRGLCYPSQAALCAESELDRKTVIASMRRLVSLGLIRDTGDRKGSTRQIVVFELMFPAPLTVPKPEPLDPSETIPKTGQLDKGPENGTVPIFPLNGAVFPIEGSRFSRKGSQKRDTEPSEPSRNPKEPSFIAAQPEFALTDDDDEAPPEPPMPIAPIVPIAPTKDRTTKAKRVPNQTRITADWSPDQTGMTCAMDNGVNVRTADWDATWRTWCGNAKKFSGGGGRGPRPTATSTWDAVLGPANGSQFTGWGADPDQTQAPDFIEGELS